jgi:hypothetical protein
MVRLREFAQGDRGDIVLVGDQHDLAAQVVPARDRGRDDERVGRDRDDRRDEYDR